ncbi:Uncharacterised protein [Mycobacterium tuberculosis]|nr:Uncharacterised protein [Mycobacterium tuberculosis]
MQDATDGAFIAVTALFLECLKAARVILHDLLIALFVGDYCGIPHLGFQLAQITLFLLQMRKYAEQLVPDRAFRFQTAILRQIADRDILGNPHNAAVVAQFSR